MMSSHLLMNLLPLNKPNKLKLMPNIMKTWSSATEKLLTPLIREMPMLPLKLNAKLLLPTLKNSSLLPNLNLPRPSITSPSLLELSKKVLHSEPNKLPTTLSAKPNINRPSMLFLKPSELLTIFKWEDLGSNSNPKLKKLLKKLNH